MSLMRVGAASDLPRRRFTVEEVYRMTADGILHEDEPVQLLDGELVVVSPQDPSHAACVAELTRRLAEAYAKGHHVRSQLPLEATPDSLPEPDVAVVAGEPRDYRRRHPAGRDVRLVVEVARTSQELDHRKAAIYARGGVPVYWLVDLQARTVDVFTDPAERGTFERRQTLSPSEQIELPGLGIRWAVSDLVA
jgi:Uma2 family endonuclease